MAISQGPIPADFYLVYFITIFANVEMRILSYVLFFYIKFHIKYIIDKASQQTDIMEKLNMK